MYTRTPSVAGLANILSLSVNAVIYSAVSVTFGAQLMSMSAMSIAATRNESGLASCYTANLG